MTVTLFNVEDNSFGVPAGWYPDPLGLPQLRWWDAQAWTEHTSDARAPIVVQPATKLAFADDDYDDDVDELPSRREQRDRERTDNGNYRATGTRNEPEPDSTPVHEELSAQPLLAMTLRELEAPVDEMRTDEPQLLPKSATAHANTMPGASTLSSYAEEEAPQREIRQHRTYNPAVWLIAVLPLLQLATSIFLIAVAGLGDNLPLLLVVWIAPYVVVLGLAAYDNLLLQVWGHERPANAAWAFLSTPVYLVTRGIRTMRETGKGIAPIATWSGTVVALVVGMLVLPGLVISLIPQIFSTQVENSVQAQAAALGANIELDCPTTPPVLVGETFTCRAVMPSNGQRDSILVGLQRENGWISWRVEDWGLWTLFG